MQRRPDDRHESEDFLVEVRPAPISETDEHAKVLHAVLQDHTYVLLRPGDQKPGGIVTEKGQMYESHFSSSRLDKQELGIAMALAEVGNSNAYQIRQPSTPQLKCTTTDLLNAAMGLGHYPLPGNNQQDEDNCSIISNDSQSGRNIDNDLGEETETAPEGDGEEDSVTRCICELTHDDGYMICCDKCSSWQHVDCMGIDRMNIPDEYHCEVCQPRPMDKNRARTLQLLKRREQQNLPLLHAVVPGRPMEGIADGGAGGGIGLNHASGPSLSLLAGSPLADSRTYNSGESANHRVKTMANLALKKNKSQIGSRRKSELSQAFTLKKQKRDLQKGAGGSVGGGKRKERKLLSKKRSNSGSTSLGSGKLYSSGTNVQLTAGADRAPTNSLAENYETAITNHYSPELRARLQTISKQQQLMSPTGRPALRIPYELSGRCTTVPHAGGKILISTFEVAPGELIVELRGKYMLSMQFRQQNSGHGNRSGPHGKAVGPFIFFHRLVNDATELCVDTRTYGNDARFVRRSCRPNAEIVHHMEKGTIHLYIVALQQIRSSTEITIKHEPHDLLAVSRAQANGDGHIPQPTSTSCGCGLVKDCLFYNPVPTGVAVSQDGRLAKRVLSSVQKPRTTSTGSGLDEPSLPVRRHHKGNLRNSRSTSSSGESYISLVSPSVKTLVSVEGVKQPETQPAQSHVVAESAVKEEVHSPMPTDQLCITATAPKPLHMVVVDPKVEIKEEIEDVHLPDPMLECTSLLKKEEVEETVAKVEEECTAQETHLSGNSVSQKKSKELKSLNEENLKASPTNSRAACEESRKLTREERKMEAIMKAFEKMEKSTMRKQDGRRNGSGGCSGGDSVEKRRFSISGRKDMDEMGVKKKKRKGSKAYQQVNQRRIRRKSSTTGNDDVFTSEESSVSLLASPPISVPYSYPSLNSQPRYDGSYVNGEQKNAANMLLSLANAPPADCAPSDRADIGSGSMSSVYMLVEAAIAPLEAASDFKMPKTKKSIMNDWLSAENSPQTPQPFESLIQAACGEMNSHSTARVEESVSEVDGIRGAQETSNLDSLEPRLSVLTSLPTPPSTGGSESAVKKRWLRQAISEECSDEQCASPTNGYATPLKKRRIPVECSSGIADTVDDVVPVIPNLSMDCEVENNSCSVEPSPTLSTADFPLNLGTDNGTLIPDPQPPPTNECVAEEERPVIPHCSPDGVESRRHWSPQVAKPEEETVVRLEELPKIPSVEAASQDLSEMPPVETVPIVPEEFDIEPLHPQDRPTELSQYDDGLKGSLTAGEDGDEIADIQKRLHSFHAENILFLKSLNKKTKPNRSPPNSDCPSAYSSASVSASSSGTSSPIASPKTSMADTLHRRHSTTSLCPGKRKKLDFDGEMKEQSDPSQYAAIEASWPDKGSRRRAKSRFSSPISGELELKDLNSNTLSTTVKQANASESVVPTETFISNNSFGNGAGHPQMSMINTMIPPPRMSYMSMYGGTGMGMTPEDPVATLLTPTPASSSRLLLSELLENAQKISSPTFTDTSNYPNRSASFLSLNCDTPSPAPPVVKTRPLIRTASADPRLNPNLNAIHDTPPAPKRKLSINEYRKRMQQTPTCDGSESNSPSGTSSPTSFLTTDQNAVVMDGGEHRISTDVSNKTSKGSAAADILLDVLCDSNSSSSPPSNVECNEANTEKGELVAEL